MTNKRDFRMRILAPTSIFLISVIQVSSSKNVFSIKTLFFLFSLKSTRSVENIIFLNVKIKPTQFNENNLK